MNSVLWNRDLTELAPYLRYLAEIGVDAVIATDPAVLQLISKFRIPLSIHISTQANTTNYLSCLLYTSIRNGAQGRIFRNLHFDRRGVVCVDRVKIMLFDIIDYTKYNQNYYGETDDKCQKRPQFIPY